MLGRMLNTAEHSSTNSSKLRCETPVCWRQQIIVVYAAVTCVCTTLC